MLGYIGPDSFSYQASDGYEDSDPAEVQMQVTGTPAGLPSDSEPCGYKWQDCQGKSLNGWLEDEGCEEGASNLCSYEEEVEPVSTGAGDPPQPAAAGADILTITKRKHFQLCFTVGQVQIS